MRVYHDPDFPIEVTLGQAFAISLESIPSTGYTWKTEYDFSMIKLIKPQKFVPRTSRIGGGGRKYSRLRRNNLGILR